MQQSKQLRLILIVSMIVVFTLIIILAIKTKVILNEAIFDGTAEENTISILTSDVIVDQSWGSLAYKGKLMIEEQFPVRVSLYSEVNTKKLMKEKVIEAIQNDSSVIIGHGREFSGVFTEMAPNYPSIQFVTVHGKAIHDNQTVYTFDQVNIEYFAGLSAALKTKANTVGVIDSIPNEEKLGGFELGLLHYKPEVTLLYDYVGSRDNGEKAIEIMDRFISQGVDVIYSKGNGFNRNVIDYAKKKNIFVIGYLDDQSYMAKDIVLTSVLNDVSQVYVAIMNDHFSKVGIPSGTVVLNEKDGVYKLAPFGPMFSEDEKQYIHHEIQKFYDGELSF
ncbi:BMP family ABC transporter substrate-binding protein [Bacillus salitolerans]|uniref:BMP family ABC transporter substrate-binding protein n=1 Tax=Bacillus salitolerans TaxID=1437434 RepID=A0ABW4LZ19_9BACI